jgi:hypothetical protein
VFRVAEEGRAPREITLRGTPVVLGLHLRPAPHTLSLTLVSGTLSIDELQIR